MPTVVILEGIKIEMFYRDHPPPHIHASSAEYELLVCINDGTIYEGFLPKKQHRRVIDYISNPEIKEKLKKLWQEYNNASWNLRNFYK